MKCKQNKWVREPESGNAFEHLTPSTSIRAYHLDEPVLQTNNMTDGMLVLIKVTRSFWLLQGLPTVNKKHLFFFFFRPCGKIC